MGIGKSIRDRVRERAEENKYSGGGGYLRLPDGVSFLKIEKGTVPLSIIPFVVTANRIVPDTAFKDMELYKDDLWYQRSLLIHHNMGPDKKSYLCPRTIKQPCPVCEERSRLQKETGVNEKLLQELKPQHKDLFWIDSGREGVKVFEFSYANFRKKLEEEIREGKEEWAGFADEEGGFTVMARFSEETFAGRKYLEASRIDFEPRKNLDEKVLKTVCDFSDLLIVQPYEKLQAIFLELDVPAPGTPPENEVPRSEVPPPTDDDAPPPSRGRRKSEPEPEPEPEPEKEAPEPPARGRRKPEPEPEPEKETPASGKCPVGGKFGIDCDKLDDCFQCPDATWKECKVESDRLAAEGNSRRRR